MCVCLSACLSVCLSFCLSACLPACLFVYLSACLFVCLSYRRTCRRKQRVNHTACNPHTQPKNTTVGRLKFATFLFSLFAMYMTWFPPCPPALNVEWMSIARLARAFRGQNFATTISTKTPTLISGGAGGPPQARSTSSSSMCSRHK